MRAGLGSPLLSLRSVLVAFVLGGSVAALTNGEHWLAAVEMTWLFGLQVGCLDNLRDGRWLAACFPERRRTPPRLLGLLLAASVAGQVLLVAGSPSARALWAGVLALSLGGYFAGGVPERLWASPLIRAVLHSTTTLVATVTVAAVAGAPLDATTGWLAAVFATSKLAMEISASSPRPGEEVLGLPSLSQNHGRLNALVLSGWAWTACGATMSRFAIASGASLPVASILGVWIAATGVAASHSGARVGRSAVVTVALGLGLLI